MFNSLKSNGLEFKTHAKGLPGKPDIIFVYARLAVFIDSDFWHGRKGHFTFPKSNNEYWYNKINGNKIRDRKNNRELKELGWNVLRFWESSVKRNVSRCVRRVNKILNETVR